MINFAAAPPYTPKNVQTPTPTPFDSPAPSRRPLREGLLAAMLTLAVSASVLLIVYQQAQSALTANLRSRLENLAVIAAGEMEAELLAGLNAPEQMGTPSYRRACEPLLRLRAAVPDVFYAYAVTVRGEDAVFLLDTSYYIRNDGDNTVVAQTGEVYADAPEALHAAWRERRVASSAEPYADKWGVFLSAFAPVADGKGGAAGLVGVDISLREFSLLLRPLNWALGVAAGLSLLGSAGIGLGRYRSQTGRERFEQQLLKASRDASEAAVAAEAASRAKGVFLATMSHEIRTPLNGVLGMTEVLAGMPLAPEQAEHVNTIRNSGEMLLTIINDILDYTKIEAGAAGIVTVPVELRPCVEETLALLAPLARKKGLTLASDWGADAPAAVRADAGRVRQILANLVGNAVKFTERGGVTLRVESAELDGAAAVALSVCDTGEGIPADRIERLFTPFTQVDDSAARRQGGTGLGLAISLKLASLMGGRLTVESEVGRGSRFKLVLPKAELFRPVATAATAAPEAGAGATAKEQAAPSLRRYRLLVAEDVESNRRVVELLLKRLGQAPVFAVDGEMAVAAWREQRPEVIFMDVSMPGMDGREASRLIRAECGDAVRPWIIALTAGALNEEHDAAIAAGMNDFITKPISGAMLAAALARVPVSVA